MKSLLIYLMAVWSFEIPVRGQEASPSIAPSPDASPSFLCGSSLRIFPSRNRQRQVKTRASDFREARNYFDRDFHRRFLKRYPKEYDHYTFVSDWKEANGERNFEFTGRKVTVYPNAENKPNLAPGPIWSAKLNGIWHLDTAKFEKVDFERAT